MPVFSYTYYSSQMPISSLHSKMRDRKKAINLQANQYGAFINSQLLKEQDSNLISFLKSNGFETANFDEKRLRQLLFEIKQLSFFRYQLTPLQHKQLIENEMEFRKAFVLLDLQNELVSAIKAGKIKGANRENPTAQANYMISRLSIGEQLLLLDQLKANDIYMKEFFQNGNSFKIGNDGPMTHHGDMFPITQIEIVSDKRERSIQKIQRQDTYYFLRDDTHFYYKKDGKIEKVPFEGNQTLWEALQKGVKAAANDPSKQVTPPPEKQFDTNPANNIKLTTTAGEIEIEPMVSMKYNFSARDAMNIKITAYDEAIKLHDNVFEFRKQKKWDMKTSNRAFNAVTGLSGAIGVGLIVALFFINPVVGGVAVGLLALIGAGGYLYNKMRSNQKPPLLGSGFDPNQPVDDPVSHFKESNAPEPDKVFNRGLNIRGVQPQIIQPQFEAFRDNLENENSKSKDKNKKNKKAVEPSKGIDPTKLR